MPICTHTCTFTRAHEYTVMTRGYSIYYRIVHLTGKQFGVLDLGWVLRGPNYPEISPTLRLSPQPRRLTTPAHTHMCWYEDSLNPDLIVAGQMIAMRLLLGDRFYLLYWQTTAIPNRRVCIYKGVSACVWLHSVAERYFETQTFAVYSWYDKFMW